MPDELPLYVFIVVVFFATFAAGFAAILYFTWQFWRRVFRIIDRHDDSGRQ